MLHHKTLSMLNSISWQAYGTTVLLVTVIYYLFVYLVYFKNRAHLPGTVGQPVRDNLSVPASAQSRTSPQFLFEGTGDFENPPIETEEHLVYACMDELTAFFEQSKTATCSKEALIASLETLLSKYPTLKNSGYKESFSHVLVTQCEQVCSIHLTAEDLVRVWWAK